MKNREIYQRDPNKTTLLNNGVTAMTDAFSDEERKTLRFELEHFVCEGEYQRGLVRILETFISNIGQPEQPAAWISGFFGSGKSHLAKMIQYLWIDYKFEEDGATARGLARLSDDVKDLLKELSTIGKRHGGLHSASGTLGSGASGSVRLAFLGIVFRSIHLPESYPQAKFCLWLKRNNIYDQVCAEVESGDRTFRQELNDMYVSPVLARALLNADPSFAKDEPQAKEALRKQFPKPKDINNDEFVQAVSEALGKSGKIPCTVVILDEVQQFIVDDSRRSYDVQELVEACSKKFGDRLLFVGTGQTALSGTQNLARLQGRFTVNVELSDSDVETVTRRVVLAKKADCISKVENILEANAGEVDRHLRETKIAPRAEDRTVRVEDYPLLPVRRRFWEQTLRAVDKAGTAGQLRTQLRIVYDAIKKTSDSPLGTVVPADFLFDEISANLLQSGVLLREIDETIRKLDNKTKEGKLKSRLCALVFLIRKLPREAAADIGVRATPETLADLLVEDLLNGGTILRKNIPVLLNELVEQGTLMKVENEYSLQTREGSEWEQEFRNRESRILNDPTKIASKRNQLLGNFCQKSISTRLTHGKSKEPRKLLFHTGENAPSDNKKDISIWIRDGWGIEEKSVLSDARSAGTNSPTIHIYIPKTQAEALKKRIAEVDATKGTLDFKGNPSGPEGQEARGSMQTKFSDAENHLNTLVKEIIENAKVFQGGGSECLELDLLGKIQGAADASLDRLFPNFKDADDSRWNKVIQRAREGAENPLEIVDYHDKIERHPICSAILSFIGSGKKGKNIRSHFEESPYGWPRDAIDAGLISLFESGHLNANHNNAPLKPKRLDQNKIPATDFHAESATIGTKQRIALRSLFQSADVPCKPNEEPAAAEDFTQKLRGLAKESGGEPPLPERPNKDHIIQIQSLVGNEQLLALFEKLDDLKKNAEDWRKAGELAKKRLPVFNNLLTLLEHGKGQDFVESVKSQIEAITQERRLLQSPDPTPDLIKTTVDGLRTALTQTEESYNQVYELGMKELQSSENWKKLNDSQREEIIKRTGLVKISKGPVGSQDELLNSLNRLSLEGWSTKIAALPQQFSEARARADKLLEPKPQHIKLTSGTLRTEEEIEAWISENKKELLKKLKDGPIVIS